jgi:hypothetical protein
MQDGQSAPRAVPERYTFDYVIGLLLRAGVTGAEAERIARDISQEAPELATAA